MRPTGALSTRTEAAGLARLHRCERGVIASAEFILVAPLFLLMLVLLWDLGMLQTAKVNLVATTRTAAFVKAHFDRCDTFRHGQEALLKKATREEPRCATTPWRETPRFWSDLDRAGGQSLVRDVRRAEVPDVITARQKVAFRFHAALDYGTMTLPDKFTAMERVVWKSDDPALTTGYDRVLYERLSRIGHLIDLFPNVFKRGR